MTTTTDFFTALRKVAGGDEVTAKTIADYIEENKELNIVKLKDVFMTKEDKLSILEYINKKIERQTTLLLIAITVGFSIIGWLIKH